MEKTMVANLDAFYTRILAFEEQSAHVPMCLRNMMTYAPATLRELVGNEQDWSMFLVDLEGYLVGHSLTLMLLDMLMRDRSVHTIEQTAPCAPLPALWGDPLPVSAEPAASVPL